MKQPMQSVGESEVFWYLALRTDHLEKSLRAAINDGCEVTGRSGHSIFGVM
jgi:hypothetical protein